MKYKISQFLFIGRGPGNPILRLINKKLIGGLFFIFSFAFYFCLTEQSHYISHAGISLLFFLLVAIALPFLHIPACYVWFHFLIAVPYLSIVMLHLDLSHNIMFHLIPPHCFISHPSHQIIFFSFHLIASYSIHLITPCSILVRLFGSANSILLHSILI